MRNVSLDHVTDATQLVCGVRDEADGSRVLVIGLQHPDGSWLLHAATPENAATIAKTLLDQALVAQTLSRSSTVADEGKKPVFSGGQLAAGPFGYAPGPLDNDRTLRAKALELSVATIQNVRGFTDRQVVQNASLYEGYIRDGVVLPVARPGEPEPIPDTEGES